MGNGIKRFLSLALALVMIIGLLPVTNVIAVGETGSAEGQSATTETTEPTGEGAAPENGGVAPVAEDEETKTGTWGGIDWSLYPDGTLVIAPTAGEPVPDKNAPTKRTYEVGEWRETVIYNSKGSASDIGGAPYDMKAVKKLVIEEGVTKIGSFTGQFPNLTGTVVIPSTVTYIGQEAFHKTPITELIFAEGGTAPLCIANGAFKKTLIEEVKFPGDREYIHIHHWAFGGSPNLKTAYIPANVTKSWGGEHVDYFDNFNSQTNVTWAEYGSIFTGCTNMETITFENEAVRDLFFANNRQSTAEDYIVAYTDLVGYNTLQKAIDAAADDGIVGLVRTITATVTVSKELTILKNGKTAKLTAGEGYEIEETADAYICRMQQDPVAAVTAGGETKNFPSLQEAFDYAASLSGLVKVTLLTDLVLDEPIVYKDTKADTTEFAAGKTITANFDGPVITVESGIFTMKNVTVVAKDDIICVNGGTVRLNGVGSGGQFTNMTSENGSCVVVNGGTVDIYGAVNMTSEGTEPAIVVNEGCTSNMSIAKWSYDPEHNISAPNAPAVIDWKGTGKLSISYGTFTGGESVINMQSGELEITSGTFTATNPVVLSDAVTSNITGGTYSNYIPSTYCAEGYLPVHNNNKADTWTVKEATAVAAIGDNKFASVQDAFRAAKSGDEIDLLVDVVNAPALVRGNVTLDLNGHSYTQTAGNSTKVAFGGSEYYIMPDESGHANKGILTLLSGAALTVKDSSEDETGYMESTVGAVFSTAGSITFENGTYKAGTFKDGKDAAVVAPRVQNYDAAVYVKGGEFYTNSGAAPFALGHAAGKTYDYVVIEGAWFSESMESWIEEKNARGFEYAQTPMNGGWYVDQNMVPVAINIDTNVIYSKVSDATNEAESGETVKVLVNVTEDMVKVPVNVTLDLNGNTVTTNYVSSFGHLVDSSDGNVGVLKVPSNAIFINDSNKQLPAYDSNAEGYRFFDLIKFRTLLEVIGEGESAKIVYRLLPYFDPDLLPLLKDDGGVAAGVSVGIYATWGTNGEQNFVYSADLVKQVVASYNADINNYGKLYILTIKNFAAFENLKLDAFVSGVDGVKIMASYIEN